MRSILNPFLFNFSIDIGTLLGSFSLVYNRPSFEGREAMDIIESLPGLLGRAGFGRGVEEFSERVGKLRIPRLRQPILDHTGGVLGQCACSVGR